MLRIAFDQGVMIDPGWRKGMIVVSSVIGATLLWRLWQGFAPATIRRLDKAHPQGACSLRKGPLALLGNRHLVDPIPLRQPSQAHLTML